MDGARDTCADRASPIRVALIVPEGPLDPGAAFLIRWLEGDPRMVLAGVSRGATPAARGLWSAVLAAEAKVLGSRSARDPGARLPDFAGGAVVTVDLTGAGAVEGDGMIWRVSARAPFAGVAEAARGRPWTDVQVTGCTGAVIAQARYGTKQPASRNRAFIAEKSAQLVARALAELHLTRAEPRADIVPLGGADAAPSPLALIRYGGRIAQTAARLIGTRLGAAVGLCPGAFALRLCHGGPLGFDPAEGVTLVPPRGHFWADPFLFEHDGVTYLYYEDFDAGLGRGTLQVGRLEGDALQPLGPQITADHHLSYPFVFAADGEIWMLPETIGANRLELWRAVEFPMVWERETCVLEGHAPADSVLAEIEGQWWLFTNLCHDSFGDYCSELHVFRADGPRMTQLEPHPLNPVVIDSCTARGGGRVWAQDGRLYRASQDNSHGLYGWGLNVMEITRLDMSGYGERRVRHVMPGFLPGVIGCHHMDFAGDRVVLDLRYRFGAGR